MDIICELRFDTSHAGYHATCTCMRVNWPCDCCRLTTIILYFTDAVAYVLEAFDSFDILIWNSRKELDSLLPNCEWLGIKLGKRQQGVWEPRVVINITRWEKMVLSLLGTLHILEMRCILMSHLMEFFAAKVVKVISKNLKRVLHKLFLK